ncbi:YciI family protein [Ferrimonas balearica]|uniref:YciI family protein n=1 Tax=Ferrimonas balearica TaxID=44012 RepID=UPI001C99B9E9|nr:YciI family protein [Ferrimonas balearica]MBY5991177.1 hypothetical protein [Ferrimonas balearica]
MYIVLLGFAKNRDARDRHMEAHREWIRQGFDDGVFLLAGPWQPQKGGTLLAHNLDREQLERRLADDPFVANQVVSAEILEMNPALADERLQFLLA